MAETWPHGQTFAIGNLNFVHDIQRHLGKSAMIIQRDGKKVD